MLPHGHSDRLLTCPVATSLSSCSFTSELMMWRYSGCWFRYLPSEYTRSSVSGITLGDSSSSIYSSKYPCSLIKSGCGLIYVPHLLAINAMNVLRLILSPWLWFLIVCNGHVVRRVTTLPFAFSTNCAISFPPPSSQQIMLQSTSRLKGNCVLFSRNSTSCTIYIDWN